MKGDAENYQKPNDDREILQCLAQAAPNLESLTMAISPSMSHFPGRTLSDQHFLWTSHNFQFSRLSVLSLCHIVTTRDSLADFLRSASPTLRKLIFWNISFTDDKIFLPGPERDIICIQEGIRVCQEVCNFLQDNFLLRYLSLGAMKYHRQQTGLFDPVHNPEGPNAPVRASSSACYVEEETPITFREWIGQLRLIEYRPPYGLCE
ncbi:hypothetical protein BO71DRAFT_398847 [Aspergillus ellipticus CBS 707.79]|uniref:F-box domain-containing protein n=1 Tax=Aspergillus ellipticus CBS 707.79 TaxID=1448320 RepID=A0A319DK43_9EURO|nr:hypothetical protein BO71DRAFT_398847 [Aspergillus ellipticus CBS 707.79]